MLGHHYTSIQYTYKSEYNVNTLSISCLCSLQVKSRIPRCQLFRTETETAPEKSEPLIADALEYLLARAGVVRADTSNPSAAVRRALPNLFGPESSASGSGGGASSVFGYKKKSSGATSGGRIIRDGLRTDNDDGDDIENDWS